MPCDNCKYAEWHRTKNGKLHPDKQGRCTYVWCAPSLPKAFYFPGSYGNTPYPSGGHIERGDRATDGCCYFTQLA